MTTPKITVAMPVYNGGNHLIIAINSILSQSYTNFELIILDDGSTDGSVEKIKSIVDNRLTILVDGHNLGLAKRLNQAIELSNGKYFARMDQDDISFPERFQIQIEKLEKNPEIDLCGISAILINEHNNVIGKLPVQTSHNEIVSTPWKGFHMIHPTWVGKTAWFKQHGYSNLKPYFCEDQELLLRAYQKSHFVNLLEIQFAYRIKSEINFKKLIKTYYTVFTIFIKNFLREKKYKYATFSVLIIFARLLYLACSALRINFRKKTDPNADEYKLFCNVLDNLQRNKSK